MHDAVRPLASQRTWASVIAAIEEGADGAVPCVPVLDTIKQRQDDGNLMTLDRARLVAVQTPQAFSAASLRAAHAGEGEATDDAALVEAMGGRVVSVAGEPSNIKVTAPADLALAEMLLSLNPAPDEPMARCDVSLRVGQGFDIHPFSDDPARALVLAGVRLDGKGLRGHSDGDVVCHAVADALLGAAGLGDIGSLFPDSDPSLAGRRQRRVAGQRRREALSELAPRQRGLHRDR